MGDKVIEPDEVIQPGQLSEAELRDRRSPKLRKGFRVWTQGGKQHARISFSVVTEPPNPRDLPYNYNEAIRAQNEFNQTLRRNVL